MEDMSSDDPTAQSMPLGSIFIAIAIIVWTSVAIWLCYSGPPGNDCTDDDCDSQMFDGAICNLSESLISKVAQSFDGKWLLDGKDKKLLGSELNALDLFKLEELLSPSRSDSKVHATGSSFKKTGAIAKDMRLPPGCERQGLLNKVGTSSVAKGLLNKVPTTGGVKDSNGHLASGLSGLSLGGDKDCSFLDDDVVGDRHDWTSFREQLRDKLAQSLSNGARKATDSLDLGPVDFLKQLLHPPSSGQRGDDKPASSSMPSAKVRSRLLDGIDYDDKEVNARPTTMLSMAEHAREVGNKHLQDRHFAAATHCYEVACLLYPASVSNGNGISSGAGTCANGQHTGGGNPGQLAAYHCNCALACLELGRYGDAINEGNAALVLTPPKHLAVKALYRLAVAHANLKNPFEARRCLKKCLELDPLNEYVKAFLSRLGDEEASGPGLERQLKWIDPQKRVQCLGAVAREKAKGKKAKQCTSSSLAGSSVSGGAAGSGKDAGSATNGVNGCGPSQVRLDREASLWHSMAHHNNKLYILGGWSDGVAAPASDAASGSMASGKADVTNSHCHPEAHGSDELHVFDVETFELRQLSGPNSKPPHPCYCHTATMVGSNMVVFGGCGPPLDQPAVVMIFDVQQAKWRVPSTAGVLPRQRQGHSANAVQGDRHLCIFGGIEPTEQNRVARVYNDVHLLDLQSYVWRKLDMGGHRPPVRFGHAASNLPGSSGKLLIVGGRDHLGGSTGPSVSGGFTGLQILDTERRVWTQQPCSGTPPLQAFYHSACVLDDSTILFLTSGSSGNDGLNGRATMPLHLLDLEAWNWSCLHASGPAPAPHIGHTAALVGSRVYVYGGVVMRGGQPIADKAVYVLDAAQTRPVADDAPEREAPHAVLTSPKVPERLNGMHVGSNPTSGKGEKAKGEKVKGEPASSSAQGSSVIEKSVAEKAASNVATTSLAAAKQSASAITAASMAAQLATPPAAGASSTANSSDTVPKATPKAVQKVVEEESRDRSEVSGARAVANPSNHRAEHARAVSGATVLAATGGGKVTVGPRASATDAPNPVSSLADTAAGATPARAAAKAPTGGSNRRMAMLDLDGDFDDEPELSFEELLAQEKELFKARGEKTSFSRTKDCEGGGSRSGGGKKGHRS